MERRNTTKAFSDISTKNWILLEQCYIDIKFRYLFIDIPINSGCGKYVVLAIPVLIKKDLTLSQVSDAVEEIEVQNSDKK